MDSAATNEEIDGLLEQDKYMTLVNASGWSVSTPINLSTKGALLQGLVWDEVVGKRERQVRAFRKGLDRFGLLDMIVRHRDLAEELFVFHESTLSLAEFKNLMSSEPPDKETQPKQAKAYQWFLDYLQERAEGISSTVTN